MFLRQNPTYSARFVSHRLDRLPQSEVPSQRSCRLGCLVVSNPVVGGIDNSPSENHKIIKSYFNLHCWSRKDSLGKSGQYHLHRCSSGYNPCARLSFFRSRFDHHNWVYSHHIGRHQDHSFRQWFQLIWDSATFDVEYSALQLQPTFLSFSLKSSGVW